MQRWSPEQSRRLTPTVTDHILVQRPTTQSNDGRRRKSSNIAQHGRTSQSARAKVKRPRRHSFDRPQPEERQLPVTPDSMPSISSDERRSLIKHASSTSLCSVPSKVWITDEQIHIDRLKYDTTQSLPNTTTANDISSHMSPTPHSPPAFKKRKLSHHAESKAIAVPSLRPMPSVEEAFARFSSAVDDSESEDASGDKSLSVSPTGAPRMIEQPQIRHAAVRSLSRSTSPVLYAKTLAVPSHRPMTDAAGAFTRFAAAVDHSDSSDEEELASLHDAQATLPSTSKAAADLGESSSASAVEEDVYDHADTAQAETSEQGSHHVGGVDDVEQHNEASQLLFTPSTPSSLFRSCGRSRTAADLEVEETTAGEDSIELSDDFPGRDGQADDSASYENSDESDAPPGGQDIETDDLGDKKIDKVDFVSDAVPAQYANTSAGSDMIDTEDGNSPADHLPTPQHAQDESEDKLTGFDDDSKDNEEVKMDQQADAPAQIEELAADSDADDEFQDALDGSDSPTSSENSLDNTVQPTEHLTTPTRSHILAPSQLASAQSGPYFTPAPDRARADTPDSLATSRVPSQLSASQESDAEADELSSFSGSLESQQIIQPVQSIVKAQEQDEYNILKDIKDVWEEVSTITRTGSPWSLDDEVYDITHPHALNLTPIICNMVRQTADHPPLKRKRTAGVSSALFPPVAETKFGLLQEKLWQEPFWLLIGTTFLNKTAGRVAAPIFWQLKEQYKTPQGLAEAKEEEITELIWTLGLQRQRAQRMLKMARAWSADEPTVGKRYRTMHYPINGDGKQYKQGELIEGDEDDARGALEIGHIPGCGAYAFDSWRIFCRDIMRGVASDYNGLDAGKDFEPEWKRVLPDDKELRPYLRWMWLREGWIWDAETGMKRRTTDDEWAAAVRGQIEPADEEEQEITAAVKEEEKPRRDPKRRTRSSMQHE